MELFPTSRILGIILEYAALIDKDKTCSQMCLLANI